jgi:hypothetical protein
MTRIERRFVGGSLHGKAMRLDETMGSFQSVLRGRPGPEYVLRHAEQPGGALAPVMVLVTLHAAEACRLAREVLAEGFRPALVV